MKKEQPSETVEMRANNCDTSQMQQSKWGVRMNIHRNQRQQMLETSNPQYEVCTSLEAYPVRRCIVQRDQSTLVLSIHVSAKSQQVLDHLNVVVAGYHNNTNSNTLLSFWRHRIQQTTHRQLHGDRQDERLHTTEQKTVVSIHVLTVIQWLNRSNSDWKA